MTQKICFDCFHKLFPDKPILKVTLGRQCVVCKAQTDRTEQMIPIEAEDIPLVKQADINFPVGIGDLVDHLLEPHHQANVASIHETANAPSTPSRHSFWPIEDPDARAMHRVQCLKNSAMLGGLLFATIA